MDAAAGRPWMTPAEVTALSSHAGQVSDLVQRLRHMKLDVTEYTCLKALVLFRPGKMQTVQAHYRGLRVAGEKQHRPTSSMGEPPSSLLFVSILSQWNSHNCPEWDSPLAPRDQLPVSPHCDHSTTDIPIHAVA